MLSLMLAAAAYGAQPSFDEEKAIVEPAIRAKLVDPSSAVIEWPYLFMPGSLKAPLGRTNTGYWTCGRVDAKNQMGGYSGASWFVAMIRDGAVTSLEIGEPSEVDGASPTCKAAVAKGQLWPAAPAGAKLGFGFRPTPYGAVVQAVDAGSVADRAGMRPGAVIVSVNGAPISALPPAEQIRAVQSPAAHIVYGLTPRGELVLDRQH